MIINNKIGGVYMSADNGIYILECKDQNRVIHAQAIENLFYSPLNHYDGNLVPTRIVEYYGKSKYTRNKDLARSIAFSMEERDRGTEYGVKTFKTNKTWYQIVLEAKELAPREIEAMKSRNKNGIYDWNIKNLEAIITR